jgi:hypothetical protein
MVFPFFILAAPSKPCGSMSVVVAFALLMSKSGGATLKVIPLLGGPYEHAGPLLEILGGSTGTPIITPRKFKLLRTH